MLTLFAPDSIRPLGPPSEPSLNSLPIRPLFYPFRRRSGQPALRSRAAFRTIPRPAPRVRDRTGEEFESFCDHLDRRWREESEPERAPLPASEDYDLQRTRLLADLLDQTWGACPVCGALTLLPCLCASCLDRLYDLPNSARCPMHLPPHECGLVEAGPNGLVLTSCSGCLNACERPESWRME